MSTLTPNDFFQESLKDAANIDAERSERQAFHKIMKLFSRMEGWSTCHLHDALDDDPFIGAESVLPSKAGYCTGWYDPQELLCDIKSLAPWKKLMELAPSPEDAAVVFFKVRGCGEFYITNHEGMVSQDKGKLHICVTGARPDVRIYSASINTLFDAL